MDIRTIAAVLNGNLVLALYVSAWGAPSITIAAVELALALGAGFSTYIALRRVGTPTWLVRLGRKVIRASNHAHAEI